MRIPFFIVSILFWFNSFCQNEKTAYVYQRDSIDYNHALQLSFELDSSFNELIEWGKFERLEYVYIENYSSQFRRLFKNFQASGCSQLRFLNSDTYDFFENITFPKSLNKLFIFSDKEVDTIYAPKNLEKISHLKYFAIGCCKPLSLENCDLNKLKELDTLILEAPLIDPEYLEGLNGLKLLGVWVLTDSSMLSTIDSVLPEVEKESYCFPPEQKIRLFNGNATSVKELNLGDTLLGYDTIEQETRPTIIQKLIKHKKRQQTFIIVTQNSLWVSSDNNLSDLRKVTCTTNHPVITTNGRKKAENLKQTDGLYVLTNSGEAITISMDFCTDKYQMQSATYDIVTESGNYFVDGILILNK